MLIKNTSIFLALSLFSLTAFADGADAIRGSQANGQGVYDTPNGTKTSHTLLIDANGRTGRYCVTGTNDCGFLHDIEYNQDDTDMRGQWFFNGSRGTFVWNFDSDKTFSGNFRMHRRGEGVKYIPFDGQWDGTFN